MRRIRPVPTGANALAIPRRETHDRIVFSTGFRAGGSCCCCCNSLDSCQSRLFHVRFKGFSQRVQSVGNSSKESPGSRQIWRDCLNLSETHLDGPDGSCQQLTLVSIGLQHFLEFFLNNRHVIRNECFVASVHQLYARGGHQTRIRVYLVQHRY
jgi:hypothetical protein